MFLSALLFWYAFGNLGSGGSSSDGESGGSSTEGHGDPGPGESCPAVDSLDHTVLLPNPADCSSFYSCSNGVPILMHCPDGLQFNDKLDVCDWPQNAGCEDGKYGCVYSALCSL